jgi:undecaprenyl-diphosphatase
VSRSAVLRTFERVRSRFHEGRAEVGDEAWRAWLIHVAAGVAAMLVLMVVLLIAAQWLLQAGALRWEAAFLTWLGESGPFRFASAVFFQTFATDITLVILITATAGIAAWLRRPITALSIILAPLVADLVGRFGWLLWHRARPDLLHGGIAAPGLHAFPSGHTSKALATYGLLTIILWRASDSPVERLLAVLALLFIITAVPIGRMTMGVHWPSDVLGGFVIGGAWLAVLARGLGYERSRSP